MPNLLGHGGTCPLNRMEEKKGGVGDSKVRDKEKIKNNMTRKCTELDYLKMLFRVDTINVYRYRGDNIHLK